MNNLTIEQDGNLETLRVSLPYQAEPLQVYQNTCHPNGAHLLLDSADIGTKQQVKSLLLMSRQLTNEQQVTLALTDTERLTMDSEKAEKGQPLLRSVRLSADWPYNPSRDVPVDEDSRLSNSNMEPLRFQQQLMKETTRCAAPIFSVSGGALPMTLSPATSRYHRLKKVRTTALITFFLS